MDWEIRQKFNCAEKPMQWVIAKDCFPVFVHFLRAVDAMSQNRNQNIFAILVLHCVYDNTTISIPNKIGSRYQIL